MESARLKDKTTKVALDLEYQGIQQARLDAESGAGLGYTDRQGNFNTITEWARENFPEIPELEEVVRQAGYDLAPKTKRW